MLKTFIVYGLSFLFLSTAFHVEPYHQDHQDGYSICNINCDDENHHSISHQCEKCLNNINRFIAQQFIELSFNEYQTALYSSYENFEDGFISFNLYSRPPPRLI